MAELTNLESKLGEVLGLAQASKQATTKVGKLTKDKAVKAKLAQMGKDATDLEQRCKKYTETLDGKKSKVNAKARETKGEIVEMMKTYLDGEADVLDGFEFLVMAEAGELGHWEVLEAMSANTSDKNLRKLVDQGLKVERRHAQVIRATTLALAGAEDRNEPPS